ncbi:major facilitator superfamily domain-containing protein [Xylogone sp. PMI_703]|nr:major facilitator superfamily domain-containing protein [Xylogone sp. PMI_703]
MSESSLRRARIVSSVAATVISLACGTNYVYSAWAPQFAEKLKLSSTQSNIIGLAGNLGMYLLGIPVGMLVDARGPRLAVMAGAFFLGGGYFPLHQAFDNGSGSVPLLCLYSFLTGWGGCMAFAAAVKTSALNWPHHRGTATAFPLAAFGLSAFFFSLFGEVVFPGSTGHFLLVLSYGTFGLVFVSFFFLRVLPHPQYTSLPTSQGRTRANSNVLRRTKSEESKHRGRDLVEPGKSIFRIINSEGEDILNPHATEDGAPAGVMSATDETSSLMSAPSSSALDDVIDEENHVDKDRSHRVDIRGLKMITHPAFWQLFSLMGIMAGIGLMTINNVGNDATALWRHYDDSVTDEFIIRRQAMHVSILSICSFLGRLCSGVGSDLLVKVLHANRLWCLVIASIIFFVAQVFALNIQNPHYLGLVSGLSGLGYGLLFGCYPSIVAEAFGIHGLSTNWGFMTLAPVVSGNVFNLFYGVVFDQHSIVLPGGERSCTEGLYCYQSAYLVTLVACVLGLVLSLYSIHYRHKEDQLEALKDLEDRSA